MNGFFKDKRVMVTGHKGFIGSKIAQRVSDGGGIVIGLDRCRCDVGDYEQVARIFDRDRPQVVFHLAAQTEVGRSHERPYETYRTNVTGTLNVLECCRRWPVESAVFASSDKAYGNGPLPYGETQRLQGDADPYSNSKRMSDELCHHYADTYDMPLRVLRCANVYGPGQTNATTLVTGTILRLLRGEAPVIHGDRGLMDREWLYVDDAAEAYLLTATLGRPGKVVRFFDGKYALNVGSGNILNAYGVVNLLCEIVGRFCVASEKQRVTGRRIGDQRLDSSLFRRTFPQWQTTPLWQGLEKTVAWHKEQQR